MHRAALYYKFDDSRDAMMPRTRVVAFRSSASSKGTGCRGSTRRGMPSATASSQSSVRESERPRDDVGATNAPPNTKTAEERFVLSLASCSASVLEGSFSGMAATRSSNTRLAQRAGLSLKAHTLCMQVYAQAHQTPDATEDSEENRDSVVVPTTLPQIIKARPSQHCIQAFGLPHQGCVSMLAAAKPGIKSGSASGRVKSVQPREMIASALFVGLPLLGGALSGAASKESVEGWYKTLKKPSWTPPDAFFPIVWSSLYVAMGVAASLVLRDGTDLALPLGLWAAQLAFSFAYQPLFFMKHWMWAGLADSLAMCATATACVGVFNPINKLASLLMVPVVAWTAVASLLNWSVNDLNKKPSPKIV